MQLVRIGCLATFIWQKSYNGVASPHLRDLALRHRLKGKKAEFLRIERSLPLTLFEEFTVDPSTIVPEIVACLPATANEELFHYVVSGQSLPAETRKMRIGKFLVFDTGNPPRRLLGAICVKSPMYFDGARDRHLGWPDLHQWQDGVWGKNQEAVDLRNVALTSIYNIAVCMPIHPFDQLKTGKLLAALCLSEPVISYLETKYSSPVLGLTTTGGWGGSAGQYERIKLAAPRVGCSLQQNLFVKMRGTHRSVNFPIHLYYRNVFETAFALLKSDNGVQSREFADYASNLSVRKKLLFRAMRLVGISREVAATNPIAHYFGACSESHRLALRSEHGIRSAPALRALSVNDIVQFWRINHSAPGPVSGRFTRLSEIAT